MREASHGPHRPHRTARRPGATGRVLTGIVLSLLVCLAGPALGSAYEGSMEQQPFGPINADFNHALLLIQRGDFAAAVPLLEKVVREDDRDAEAYHMLGLCQRKLERYDEALRSDGRALAIEPHHRGAHAAIGETYLALNQPAKAKEHLAVLDADCWFGCTEYDALKAAIARYEAKGGS